MIYAELWRLHDALGRSNKWAETLFASYDLVKIAKSLVGEADELANTNTIEEYAEELADCAMVNAHATLRIEQLAVAAGIDLAAEVEKKLHINMHERQWAERPDGMIKHVRVEGEGK